MGYTFDLNFRGLMNNTLELVKNTVDHSPALLTVNEVGHVRFVGQGVVRADGLPGVRSEEVVVFSRGEAGLAFNLDETEVGIILLNHGHGIRAGDEIHRTKRVLDVPVGEALIGRVVDGVGRPLDNNGPILTTHRFPVERSAPAIMDRAPVTEPLQTGWKVVDTLIPVGRGQRQLILGDRQTGKTAIAMDTINNQHDKNVVCIYCGIGQRASALAKCIHDLRKRRAMAYSVVVATTEDDPPGLQYITPYAATSIGEYFMEQGRDVLVIFDDLTRHARAYRELSLLLRRPPGREAFPGDIFYVHSRLLERSTHLSSEKGGGSLTAFPICETEAQNLSAYIPTNLISITDGQIYLSPTLFQKSVLPAIDVGKSVSRVGGKTQLPVYRGLSGDLRLSYAQFAELEMFARFGTRLDDDTRKALERGWRVREVLKQNQFQPLSVPEQIAILFAVNEGVLDDVPLSHIAELEHRVCAIMMKELPILCQTILDGNPLAAADRDTILEMVRREIGR